MNIYETIDETLCGDPGYFGLYYIGNEIRFYSQIQDNICPYSFLKDSDFREIITDFASFENIQYTDEHIPMSHTLNYIITDIINVHIETKYIGGAIKERIPNCTVCICFTFDIQDNIYVIYVNNKQSLLYMRDYIKERHIYKKIKRAKH